MFYCWSKVFFVYLSVFKFDLTEFLFFHSMARFNPLKFLVKKIPAPLRNKYVLTLCLFVVWMLIFDKHDVMTQWSLGSTYYGLIEEKENYREKIKQTREDKININKDIEKYAREKYYMKRKNEDVFIFVDEK